MKIIISIIILSFSLISCSHLKSANNGELVIKALSNCESPFNMDYSTETQKEEKMKEYMSCIRPLLDTDKFPNGKLFFGAVLISTVKFLERLPVCSEEFIQDNLKFEETKPKYILCYKIEISRVEKERKLKSALIIFSKNEDKLRISEIRF